MSKFFNWSDEEYGLGVHNMDEEHQVLIDKMNALFEAANSGENYLVLKGLVQDLADYTVKHFDDEEAFMEGIGFSGLANHKIIHQQLLKQFQNHVSAFHETESIHPKFFDFLKVWLSAHIHGIDMRYGDFQKLIKAS